MRMSFLTNHHTAIHKTLSYLLTGLGSLMITALPASGLINTVEYEKAVDDLWIGVVLPLTGHNSAYGQQILQGMESALSPLSHTKLAQTLQHYPLFHKVKLLVRDHGGDIDKGKLLVDELYTEHRVSVVVGGLSTLESQNYAEISSRRAKIFISLLPKTLPNLHQHSRAISFASNYPWQLKVIAQYLKSKASPPPVLVTSDQLDEHHISSFFNILNPLSTHDTPSQPTLDQNPRIINIDTNLLSHPPHQEDSQTTQLVSPMQAAAQEIYSTQTEVVVITLGLKQSKALLNELQNLGFTGSIYGLDYWDHPSFRLSRHAMDIHYVVQYDTTFFSEDFKQVYYFHTQTQPTVLSALGYDVTFFLLHLYQQTKSIRIPPFLQLIENNQIIQTPASFAGLYRRSPHHFIERKMVLRSLHPNSTQIIGDITPNASTHH